MTRNFTLKLSELRLQNFATFENQTIHFNDNFNAIIGETGSGKSLILDAIHLILGARADKKIVRKNASSATVEAVFNIDNLQSATEYFEKFGYPLEADQVVIKRIISTTDMGKNFLNFQNCPIKELQKFAKHFIDLVGQFDNQKLLSDDYQIQLLDGFSELDQDVLTFKKAYNNLSTLRHELAELTKTKEDSIKHEDYLRFQIEEIEKLSPSVSDEESLLRKKEFHLNRESMDKAFLQISDILVDGEEFNVERLLKKVRNILHSLDENDTCRNALNKIEEASALIEDASYEISKLQNDFNFSENVDEIIERLDLYQKLKRKHGGTTEELVKNYERYSAELQAFESIDVDIDSIKARIDELEDQCHVIAEQIHANRIQNAKRLSHVLTQEIRELKMDGASIVIQVHRLEELNANGLSRIEFLAETNPGEGLFKIKDIASGGELSRILLAVRKILSSNDSISVFLFDEIDTGIGGTTALSIGKTLKEVSETSQVIAITHLAQIANFADYLIHVTKKQIEIEGGETRTRSLIEEITTGQKTKFISNMNPLQ